MNDSQSVFGIDLGTTFCACARAAIGEVDVQNMRVDVTDRGGKQSLPSVVCAEVGAKGVRAHVGVSAYERFLTSGPADERVLIERAKREIGVGSRVWPIGDHDLDAVDVSALILKKIRQTVESEEGIDLGPTVVTHPRDFSNRKKEATFAAASAAGLDLIDTLNEPEAAAYMHFEPHEDREPGHYLVFDLGGGTLDIAVMDVPAGRADHPRIVSGHGEPVLGGSDWDKHLFDLIVESGAAFTGRPDFAASLRAASRARLMELARTFKVTATAKRLVFSKTLQVIYEDDSCQDIDIRVERAAWEARCRSLVDRCEQAIDEAVKDLGDDRVVRVLPVGGSTRLESIRTLLRRRFGDRVEFNDERFPADYVVAQGAARFASLCAARTLAKTTVAFGSKIKLAESVAIDTTLAQGINVLIQPGDRKLLHPIVHRGASVPAKQRLPFEVVDAGEALAIEIYEGEPGELMAGAHASVVVTLPREARATKGDRLTIEVDVGQSSRFAVTATHERSNLSAVEVVGHDAHAAGGSAKAVVAVAGRGLSVQARQKKIAAIEVF